eukprot:gene30792-421_t
MASGAHGAPLPERRIAGLKEELAAVDADQSLAIASPTMPSVTRRRGGRGTLISANVMMAHAVTAGTVFRTTTMLQVVASAGAADDDDDVAADRRNRRIESMSLPRPASPWTRYICWGPRAPGTA